MELLGWNYEGRKVDKDLHGKMVLVIDHLKDPEFVRGRKWGTKLQDEIAEQLGIKGGSIRTIKRMMEQFGIIKKGVLHSTKVPDGSLLLTKEGEMLYPLVNAEQAMDRYPDGDSKKKKLEEAIEELYRSIYSKAVFNYYYENGARGDSKRLYPIKALLKALRKHQSLDFWEWYIFTTIITEDDNLEQERQLDKAISDYRKGALVFEKGKDEPKKYGLAHSYILPFFELGGFIKVRGTSKYNMSITESDLYPKLKAAILNSN